jgi:hypothetical protein
MLDCSGPRSMSVTGVGSMAVPLTRTSASDRSRAYSSCPTLSLWQVGQTSYEGVSGLILQCVTPGPVE